MRYVYYIIIIIIIFSGLAVYGLLDTRVEISEPVLSINDRIISQNEFEKMLDKKSPNISREQFIDSVIDRQLLIQEAIQSDIHKEENFRRLVEDFYEQLLINTFQNRKLASIVVDATNDEIEKYETLIKNKFFLTKMIFPSMKDARLNTNGIIEKIELDFLRLSDDLKFIVLNLNTGEFSKPRMTDSGVFVYRLDDIQKRENPDLVDAFDIKQVSLYIQDKKKKQILDEWADSIRETAEIWRKNE